MELADDLFYDYEQADRQNLSQFASTWQEKGISWQLPNLTTDRTFVDNSTFEEGYCQICQKAVTWKSVTQASNGANGLGAANGGDHYYLEEDILYTGTGDYFLRAPGTGGTACLHLNGHNITATASPVLVGYAGRLNVMGNGTVCGNATEAKQGATVHMNTGGKNGQIHLYGGTYTKAASNAEASVAAAWNGGQLYIHEGATICGTGGYCVYGGEATAAPVLVAIDGATVTGGVIDITEADLTAGFGNSLTLSGKATVEELLLSATTSVSISGAPIVDRLAVGYGQLLELNNLCSGTDITFSARGCFTKPNEKMAQYAAYFRPWVTTDKLVVDADNTLRYDVNHELYMTPYIRDVVAEAVADGKIHYYFMAGEGMIMNPITSGELDKWGDCCLIVFPNGETMLVDTGYWLQQPVFVGNLNRMGITKLDYLLITHPHTDHQGAFYANSIFFDHIEVEQVFHNPLDVSNSTTDTRVAEVCAARNIPCTALKQGAELDFGDVHMEVLWPEAGTENITIGSGKINDHSMVFRLDYGEHSALFTADIYELAEGQILDTVDSAKLDADFLKVPHHGWNTSSSEAFVKAVSATLAVATGRVDISESFLNTYTSAGTELLMDLYRGYIHVEADAEGNMTYETSR